MIDTAREFQARRRQTWRRMRYSVAIAAGCLAYLALSCKNANASEPERLLPCILVFAVMAAAIIHINVVWKRSYRCPACDEPVRDTLSTGGMIPVDPHECPHCGARLR